MLNTSVHEVQKIFHLWQLCVSSGSILSKSLNMRNIWDTFSKQGVNRASLSPSTVYQAFTSSQKPTRADSLNAVFLLSSSLMSVNLCSVATDGWAPLMHAWYYSKMFVLLSLFTLLQASSLPSPSFPLCVCTFLCNYCCSAALAQMLLIICV